ncbi:MAG: hypothetical protein ACM3O7_08095 [Acidobacteriota bacterium]
MRRIDPAFPDLLPLGHRLGSVPPPGATPVLDPVEMRLVRGPSRRASTRGERTPPRRPLPLLVHAAEARREADYLGELLAAGCGVVLVLDDVIDPGVLPAGPLPGQLVVLSPRLPELWESRPLPPLFAWRERGASSGVLLALGPSRQPVDEVWRATTAARDCGAEFVLAMPLALPPQDRHRVYDDHAGESGDGILENLLFHTDLSQLAFELEREATRACRSLGLAEGLLGPATSARSLTTTAASHAMLLWARRLDLLDGVTSHGWQLRRAARALAASGRDAQVLLTEDNLRILPGFDPWTEAFSRSLWSGNGEPFEEFLARWIAQ